jgi:uncharacterized protein YqgV (UPF0045/DUF77 family)
MAQECPRDDIDGCGGGSTPRDYASTPAGVPGYMHAAVTACQFSVYPLRQSDIDRPVQAAIAAAAAEDVTVRVGNLSTLLFGGEAQVFAALRAAFRAVQSHGPAVMTATLTAGMPTDELVQQIQCDIVETASAAERG